MTEEAHILTMEEHMADLQQWLRERGLIPVVVAVGKRSHAASPIADFMPDTHVAIFTLQKENSA